MLQKSLNCGLQALKCRRLVLRWRRQRAADGMGSLMSCM
jgi:hypothetical protein